MPKILYNSDEEESDSEPIESKEMLQEPNIQAPSLSNPPITKPKKQAKNQNSQLDEPEPPIIITKPSFKCELCDKEFVRNSFLKKHKDELRCVVKREHSKKVELELEELKTKLDKKVIRQNKREQKLQEQILLKIQMEKDRMKEEKEKERKDRLVQKTVPVPVQKVLPVQSAYLSHLQQKQSNNTPVQPKININF